MAESRYNLLFCQQKWCSIQTAVFLAWPHLLDQPELLLHAADDLPLKENTLCA